MLVWAWAWFNEKVTSVGVLMCGGARWNQVMMFFFLRTSKVVCRWHVACNRALGEVTTLLIVMFCT